MKRLVLCFDGTWSRLDGSHPTNVLLTAESVLHTASSGVAQVVYYDEGVGTEEGESFSGGIFGAGLLKNLSDGYRFLIFNYSPGDEIYIFGFSRGAYTARSMVGLLATSGILARRNARRATEAIERYQSREATDSFREQMLTFRCECSPELCTSVEEDQWRAKSLKGYTPGRLPVLKVDYLGVWDTVGALGIPSYLVFARSFNQGFQFHDVSLSPMVESARHAVSIDERKRDFAPTLWDNLDDLNRQQGADPSQEDAPYRQVWFPGVHGSVGGGGERRGLSDDALDWIWEGARRAGLELDTSAGSRVHDLRPTHRDHLVNTATGPGGVVGFVLDKLPRGDRQPGPTAIHEVSASARRRWKEAPTRLPESVPYRPATLQAVAHLLESQSIELPGEAPEDLPAEYEIYIVQERDTLRTIAQHKYGNAELCELILAANRSKIAAASSIYRGQMLRLPALAAHERRVSPPLRAAAPAKERRRTAGTRRSTPRAIDLP